jgi:serine/threonine protein phosphatase PrpC
LEEPLVHGGADVNLPLGQTPEQAVDRLIDLANAAGGPDNIACVVADVVEPQSVPG